MILRCVFNTTTVMMLIWVLPNTASKTDIANAGNTNIAL